MAEQENAVLISIESVVFDEKIYPRKELNLDEVDRLAELLADGVDLPPIDINQDKKLLDGRHRLMAHRKNGRKEIRTVFHVTENEYEAFVIACQKNSDHGRQLTKDERRDCVLRLYKQACEKKGPYGVADGEDKRIIAKSTGVSTRSVERITQELRKEVKENREQEVRQLSEEGEGKKQISRELNLKRDTVSRVIKRAEEGGAKTTTVAFAPPDNAGSDISQAIREEREKYGVTLQYFNDKLTQIEKLVKEYRLAGDRLRNDLIQFCQDVKDQGLKKEIDRVVSFVLDDHDEFYALYKRSNVIQASKPDTSNVFPLRGVEKKTA